MVIYGPFMVYKMVILRSHGKFIDGDLWTICKITILEMMYHSLPMKNDVVPSQTVSLCYQRVCCIKLTIDDVP